MTVRVVLTGASGFIGSAVLRRLTRHDGVRVRALTRRDTTRPDNRPDIGRDRRLPAGTEQFTADLARPETLAGSCSGADVLVHAASHVGPDEQQCAAVNDDGTRALLHEARRAGVRRIVQFSTTAVYGRGPHRAAAVGDLDPRPGSATSRSRLAGEQHALREGALVLRTGLITGPGDRWVVPALAELTRRVPGYWRGGHALLSLIDVDDLARLAVRAALPPPGADPPHGVHHAVHPDPVRIRDLLDALAALGLLPRPDGDMTWRACLDRLERTTGRTGERQLRLLAFDHHYVTGLWQACELAPRQDPLTALAEAADWYRAHLARP